MSNLKYIAVGAIATFLLFKFKKNNPPIGSKREIMDTYLREKGSVEVADSARNWTDDEIDIVFALAINGNSSFQGLSNEILIKYGFKPG